MHILLNNFFTASSLGFGEILLLLSLTCDGLTGAIQERMKSDHKTKSGHMMTNMNMWSFLMLGVTLLITGELLEFVNFVSRHPDILWQLASVCIAMSLGQVILKISRNFFDGKLWITIFYLFSPAFYFHVHFWIWTLTNKYHYNYKKMCDSIVFRFIFWK